MTLTQHNGGRRRISSAVAACTLLLVATLCGTVLLALPRTAIPRHAPALHIDRAAADALRDSDRKLAKQAPDTDVAKEIDALLHDKGESERVPTESIEVHRQRTLRIKNAIAYLKATAGPDAGAGALAALRARATERMQAALEFRLPKAQIQGVMGSFPTGLREAQATRDGVLVAPILVVRTLYKVRWNVIMGLPRLDGLVPLERQAFAGWYALHADEGPPIRRLTVLDQFAAEGGYYVHEARAVIAYQASDPIGARRELELAEAARPSLRLRNMRLSAMRAERTLKDGL